MSKLKNSEMERWDPKTRTRGKDIDFVMNCNEDFIQEAFYHVSSVILETLFIHIILKKKQLPSE